MLIAGVSLQACQSEAQPGLTLMCNIKWGVVP